QGRRKPSPNKGLASLASFVRPSAQRTGRLKGHISCGGALAMLSFASMGSGCRSPAQMDQDPDAPGGQARRAGPETTEPSPTNWSRPGTSLAAVAAWRILQSTQPRPFRPSSTSPAPALEDPIFMGLIDRSEAGKDTRMCNNY